MNDNDRAEFCDAILEALNLIERTQAVLQRAKRRCNGELFDHTDLISKRVFEVRVRSEWLRLVAVGVVEMTPSGAGGRDLPDRRQAIDRRVAGMRRQILAATAKAETTES